MMTFLAAQEPILEQVEALVSSVGLRLVKVVQYTEELADSVLIAVPR